MVTIYGRCLDPWLLFAAKSCMLNNVMPRLVVDSMDKRMPDSDELDCIKWLRRYPTISLEYLDNPGTLKGDTCFAVLRGCYGNEDRVQIKTVISGFTRRIGLLRLASDSKAWQLKQICRDLINPYYSEFTEIWSEDASISLLRAFLNKHHRFYGALPHQRCTVAQENWDLLLKDPPLGPRAYLFSWAGTSNFKRESILHWIEERIKDDRLTIDLGPLSGTHKIIWHNDAVGGSRERSYSQYTLELGMAWFCLCLPGYTGITHRLLEAVLCGSIPVIQEEQILYYSLPLVDGVNSIFVKQGRWNDAIHRISKISNHERLCMQSAVVEMAETTASLISLSQRLFNAITGNESL